MNGLDRLLGIMKTLRDPHKGCPWDRQQTYASIAPYTLEETHELLDAISRGNIDDMQSELGDLLFQVVFYARIAEEEGRFNFDAVCNTISDKLQRRHPHIFGAVKISSSQQVLPDWEQIKTFERAEKQQHSALGDIPRTLPALMRAHKIQKRCSNVGFDWQTLGPVLDKVYEEIDEVMHEVRQPVVDQQKLEEEIGDFLFAAVNFTRHLGSKAEMTLQKANDKFERRFRRVEEIIAAQGMAMQDTSLEQMEAVWRQVKSRE
ncbi:nucleoside triphosphate pyrophosphohydrolase [Erwinia tracheiphila]|uniref:Nucleoside triphosphate pyrophosphohydrolase n=1 Tax=Erwinia tracheiphila TaxID=65700 RepID=A0A0M2KDT7_9GAMM|nr:nucleoside triphosphate pyrophosphohydrolase [Erwinia tracheiphila]EOS96052.1 nucleoside triphosphate pyrophosphohydrolase [Erwinia tracheiphila PSU-1]KKF35373.1 nucleoside triphosphate hydrolase [Erwinia tracheiphila]UIA87033.1 nucleoside triphosphate pyrophosphohydrolase [Erwinia tracheiphila]UIA95391.1 nucleoside triphosphate pyrophosphohydrolase [Erwinia tracheiphila]